jgi:hypothetical protein
MGNCCKAASSMEFGGEDWGSLNSSKQTKKPKPKACRSSSSKVFDEARLDHPQKENDLLERLRASGDASGKVTLKISKSELAELLGAIQNSSNNQQPQKQMKKKMANELGSAEQVLYRLIKARDNEIANKHDHWKPMLETIPECC